MAHNCKYTTVKYYDQIVSVAYRQHKADTHCNKLHGYSLSFCFHFSTNHLDVRDWGLDFGGLRPVKEFIEQHFDHCLLVALDDPHHDELMKLDKLGIAKVTEVEKTSSEAIADLLYEWVNTDLLPIQYQEGDRIWCTRVEVHETNANMAIREGYRDLN